METLSKNALTDFIADHFEDYTGLCFSVNSSYNKIKLNCCGLPEIKFDFDLTELNGETHTNAITLEKIFLAIDILRSEYSEQMRNYLNMSHEHKIIIKDEVLDFHDIDRLGVILDAIEHEETNTGKRHFVIDIEINNPQEVIRVLRNNGYRVAKYNNTYDIRWDI